MFDLLLSIALMSVGWALRGSIGGGPLGAMIPGALWAMGMAWRRGWSGREASFFVALAALGIGLGGQMTYGQTIGLFRDPNTRLWGLAGLSLKGAIWGLLGGVILSLAWLMPAKPLRLALLLLAATDIGWRWVNHPKLLYFSNPLDRPREEVWAGLLLSALVLLLALRHPLTRRFALLGLTGGALGFGGGAFFNLVPMAGFPGWKMMEFTFGAILGGALHFAVPAATPKDSPSPSWQHALFYPLWCAVIIAVGLHLPVRYAYSAVVAISIVLLSAFPQTGWLLAFGATLAAACLDLHQTHPLWAILLGSLPVSLVFYWQRASRCLPRDAAWLLLACCAWIYCLEYFPVFR
ncbi:MAG: hypothetical protein ACK6DZ_01665 [Acidobacteriota bacterium]